MEQLRTELEAMKVALQEEKEERQKATVSSSTIPPASTRQVYVAAGRRLERFRGKPEKSSDPTVQEWVTDVKGQLTTRQFEGEDASAFIVDHLAGRARQEILGRGDVVKGNPEEIFRILVKVFGEGETLAQVQQKFFSYRQGPNEDLLSCSLELVELFNSIVRLDNSFHAVRDKTLKGRFAEAVRDESLKRELRRLNMDSPSLSFFDARDRAIQWLGNSPVKHQREAAVHEVKAVEGTAGLQSLLARQGEQLQRQQEQIQSILQVMTQQPIRRWNRGPRRCYKCQSTEHLKRDCPHLQSSPTSRGPHQGNNAGTHGSQFVHQQSMEQQFIPQQPPTQQFVPQQPPTQQFIPQQSPAQQFVHQQSQAQQLN